MWASFYGDLFLVLRLLQEGADVNLRDGLGRAPLWAAAVNNHVDVTQLLLEHGADVAAMDYPGWTYILLYERRAFYSEIRRLLADHGYTDDREAITSSTWNLVSMREKLLSQTRRYVDLMPMLREKYRWLHETAGKIRAGIEVFATGTSGPEEDLRSLEMQLTNPYLVLMKLGVSYCRSGNYGDGIKELSAIMTDREREPRQPHLDVDTLIGRVELGNLYYLSDDIEAAGREWKAALAAATELEAASAVQHLLGCLAALESEDLSARTRLIESLKRRSG